VGFVSLTVTTKVAPLFCLLYPATGAFVVVDEPDEEAVVTTNPDHIPTIDQPFQFNLKVLFGGRVPPLAGLHGDVKSACATEWF